MKVDIFSEMQQPKELWGPDVENHEHRLFEETLAQAKLADEMGYGIWWEVEHHTAVEFSYSSAPEIMLTNIAANTKNLRVGHSAVLSPFRFNHPMRIAERAAFLDHVSNGRFELGLARSTIPEWRTFNIDPDETRDQMQQAFEMIPKMWTTDSFSWKSDFYEINNVSVIPKPYQKPHPKLWQACSSPTSFEQAGRNGVGALGVTLWASLDQVAEWIGLYRDAIKECDPVGEEVNDQVAFFTFVHAAESEEQAMMNGAADAAAWYTNGAFTFFEAKEAFVLTARELEAAAADPAGGGLTGQFLREHADDTVSEAQLIVAKVMEGEEVTPEEVWEVLSKQHSLIVGSQDQVREGMKVYQEAGIDRLMSFHQVGAIPHEAIMESIRLTGELIPEFDPDARG